MQKQFSDYDIQVKRSSGQEKTICPRCSHERKNSSEPCLSVNHTDGVWKCHHCDWTGGLSDKAREDLTRPSRQGSHYTKPIYKREPLPDKVIKYLCEDRKISRQVVERNQIGYQGGNILFPYFKSGEIVNVKARDAKKNFSQTRGAERTVYKFDDIWNEVTIICEGEIDALSCDTATGANNAISVPDGAKGLSFFKNESVTTRLNEVEIFVLCTDKDENGYLLEEKLKNRLGADRCKWVEFPEGVKDANQCLQEHGEQVLYDCLFGAKPYPIEGVKYADDVDLDGYYKFGDDEGLSLGFKTLDPILKLEKGVGQLIIVTGIPVHGKSEFIDQIIVNTAKKDGWKWGVFSPENYPLKYHFSKLAEKFIGLPFREGYINHDGDYKKYFNRMAPEDLAESKAWLHDHVYSVFPPEDNITVNSILGILRSLVMVHGIRAAVIDPWNEISSFKERGAATETEWIGEQLTALRRFARNHTITLFVVAHPTKLQKNDEGSYPPPTAYDIKGSSTWRDKADTILCVHRPGIGKEEADYSVDIYVQKVKKKFLGQVGVGNLHYDFKTGRYGDTPFKVTQ